MISLYNKSMNKRIKIAFAAIVGFGLLAILVLLIGPKPPIPSEIRRQLTSSPLLPSGRDIEVDPGSAKYDFKLKLLTINVNAFGHTIVLSEQATPDTLTDIPEFYEKLTLGMGEYKRFDAPVGTIHLTHPKDLGGKQAAVLNSGGTLLFAKPDRDLTEEEWRKLFLRFKVIN